MLLEACRPILLPMMIAGIGIIFSIVGTLFVRISETASISTTTVQKALNMGNWGSIILTALASVGLVYFILPETMELRGIEFTKWGVLGAIGVGLTVGTLMSIITEYYTAIGKRPVMSIIRQSSTGHATNVIGRPGCRYGIYLSTDTSTGGRYLGFLRSAPDYMVLQLQQRV